ncbi:unnamed protein product [Trichogramma brassicae]|uniref:Uncharacterized protein n=1 Tax=Trichogramma brassicae TaxID=86971 RepID=A0A6H5I3G3_9HYME|nr:unnamed protein product [Trichogramma brassicae]
MTSMFTLKSMREQVNWEIEEERRIFICQLGQLTRNWEGELPDLRDIFRDEEIEWLLSYSIEYTSTYYPYDNEGQWFIRFVAVTGYKDKPDVVDEAGKPSPRRTTPLHHATRHAINTAGPIRDLFGIYDRFDVNYIDEFGYTHFHVACRYGCERVVEVFLELGQDPNLLVHKTGDSPLHLALEWGNKRVVELLLSRGADLSWANGEGSTPLHVICSSQDDDYSTKLFLQIISDEHQTVRLNVKDKLGRTPLQLAVAYLLPDTVDALLDQGADLSSFVFPTADYFAEKVKEWPPEFDVDFKLRIASNAFIVAERLEKRGHELDRSDALTIMKLFAKHELFEKWADHERSWYADEKFAGAARKAMITSTLSLYDLIPLRPKEAAKQVSYKDYFNYACDRTSWVLRKESSEACLAHLCELMSRRFFLRWALEPFLELIQQRLPILCCAMINEELLNEDLFHICLAATSQSS